MADMVNKLFPLDLDKPGVTIDGLVTQLMRRNQRVMRLLNKVERAEFEGMAMDTYQKLLSAVDKSVRGLVQEQTRRALAISAIVKSRDTDMTEDDANKALDDILNARIALMTPMDLRRLADMAESVGKTH